MSVSLIFPHFDIGTLPLAKGDAVPAEIVVALERCSRLGGGCIQIIVEHSRQPFLHYRELVLSPRLFPGTDLEGESANDEFADADGGKAFDFVVVAAEATADLGAEGRFGHVETEVNGNLDPSLGGVEDEPPVHRPAPGDLGFDETGEVGNWSALLDFLGSSGREPHGAFGCLVSTPFGRFLATFEPLPPTGQGVR